MNHAVITGDIVRSGRLSSEGFGRVQEFLLHAGEEIRQRFSDQVPLPLDVFRGDSWQLLVTTPRPALRIALHMRAFLRAEADVDTRFAIGIGPIDAVPAKSVATGRGEAFRLSGAMLDWKVATNMRFAVAGHAPDNAHDLISSLGEESADERDARAISLALLILDIIARNWTRAQARAVCGALLEGTQEKIAESWPGEPITQQAVHQHLARAGWDGVRETLLFYEDISGRWEA
jgi:hypothetical protein